MKILGLMCTWNNLEFFKYSVHQALNFCDELILVEGCHSRQYPKHSTDGTCEYIKSIKSLPKLKIMDFDFEGRYDKVQKRIRQEFPKESALYKPGNWIFNWDDDLFFMEKELPILRTAMETTKEDALNYTFRQFIYNFRFCSLRQRFVINYRIVDGVHLAGISWPCYAGGPRFAYQYIENVEAFHYSHVKKPERMKARFVMSVEKRTKKSIGRYEKWLSVKWDKDENVFINRAIDKNVKPEEELKIYDGEHPEMLANHPWRHIEDVRR